MGITNKELRIATELITIMQDIVDSEGIFNIMDYQSDTECINDPTDLKAFFKACKLMGIECEHYTALDDSKFDVKDGE